MSSKSILWSTFVVFLFFFCSLGFYTLADACLQEYVLIPTTRKNIMPGVLAIGILLMSFAFVHIFRKWSGGEYYNKKGFYFGLWFALLEAVAIGTILIPKPPAGTVVIFNTDLLVTAFSSITYACGLVL